MRILFAALAVPFPPTNGQRLRNWALLRVLAAAGHEVVLVSFAGPDELRAELGELGVVCRRVRLVPLPFNGNGAWSSYAGRALTLASRRPYGVWRFRSESIRAAIQEELRKEHFDLLLCDDIYNVANLPAADSPPVLLNKHDITSVIVQRYIQYERNPLKRAYGRLEGKRLRRWEALACSQTAGVLACSELDRDLLNELSPQARVLVVPNVIDVEAYVPASGDDGRTVLYVGAMDWFPNRDAVEFFASAILPRLRERVPHVRFEVAGRLPSEDFRKRFDAFPKVEFTGTVPDIRPVVARAAVCVVPLRIGSGTRLKILEAAAMGKAIVSTRVGAEGLQFVNGEEILLADEPEAFAQAVGELLANAARRRALGQGARRRAEQCYSLRALQAALDKALVDLLGAPSVPSRVTPVDPSLAEGGP